MPTYKNETSDPIVENFQDAHGANVNFRIDPGKILRTEFILTNANLTELDAAPYFNPLQALTQSVTSSGVGDDKTVQIELITKSVSILNQSDAIVTIFLRSTANAPGMNCYPWTERLITVGHNVDQIVLQFSAAGTVYVEERK